ncbi:hypothetical protein GJ496_004427 [Pomphorhynchus laevis]|nr:hypothetical protein GJ496_004427 [Pomphorhynchus laevis]
MNTNFSDGDVISDVSLHSNADDNKSSCNTSDFNANVISKGTHRAIRRQQQVPDQQSLLSVFSTSRNIMYDRQDVFVDKYGFIRQERISTNTPYNIIHNSGNNTQTHTHSGELLTANEIRYGSVNRHLPAESNRTIDDEYSGRSTVAGSRQYNTEISTSVQRVCYDDNDGRSSCSTGEYLNKNLSTVSSSHTLDNSVTTVASGFGYCKDRERIGVATDNHEKHNNTGSQYDDDLEDEDGQSTENIDVMTLQRHELKWLDMLKNWPLWMNRYFVRLKRRCRKGIPMSIRGRAWRYLSGAVVLENLQPSLFTKLSQSKQADPRILAEITKDLHRSFPNHELFYSSDKDIQYDNVESLEDKNFNPSSSDINNIDLVEETSSKLNTKLQLHCSKCSALYDIANKKSEQFNYDEHEYVGSDAIHECSIRDNNDENVFGEFANDVFGNQDYMEKNVSADNLVSAANKFCDSVCICESAPRSSVLPPKLSQHHHWSVSSTSSSPSITALTMQSQIPPSSSTITTTTTSNKSCRPRGQSDLYNVLKAYSLYNKNVGYCQALAPIASVLLMHLPANQAFWVLVCICQFYMPNYYGPGLDQFRRDGEFLKLILNKYNNQHQCSGILAETEPMLYMTEWFMCIFSRSLPWSSVLRVWDMFFCEGPKVLFKVALAWLNIAMDQFKEINRSSKSYGGSSLGNLVSPRLSRFNSSTFQQSSQRNRPDNSDSKSVDTAITTGSITGSQHTFTSRNKLSTIKFNVRNVFTGTASSSIGNSDQNGEDSASHINDDCLNNRNASHNHFLNQMDEQGELMRIIKNTPRSLLCPKHLFRSIAKIKITDKQLADAYKQFH